MPPFCVQCGNTFNPQGAGATAHYCSAKCITFAFYHCEDATREKLETTLPISWEIVPKGRKIVLDSRDEEGRKPSE